MNQLLYAAVLFHHDGVHGRHDVKGDVQFVITCNTLERYPVSYSAQHRGIYPRMKLRESLENRGKYGRVREISNML